MIVQTRVGNMTSKFKHDLEVRFQLPLRMFERSSQTALLNLSEKKDFTRNFYVTLQARTNASIKYIRINWTIL